MLCNRLHVAFTSHLNDRKCGSLHLLFGIIECLGPGCRGGNRNDLDRTFLPVKFKMIPFFFFFFSRCSDTPVLKASWLHRLNLFKQLAAIRENEILQHDSWTSRWPFDAASNISWANFILHSPHWLEKWANKDESSAKTLRGSVLNYAAVWWSTHWPWRPVNPATSGPAGRPRLAGLGVV